MKRVKRPFMPIRQRRKPRDIHPHSLLERMLSGLEGTATTVLHSAGLADLIHLNTADDFSLREELEQRGFDWETKEGYAAQIMQAIHLLRRAEGAARTIIAIKLGSLNGRAAMHPDWERGALNRERLASVTNTVHGSPQQRRRK